MSAAGAAVCAVQIITSIKLVVSEANVILLLMKARACAVNVIDMLPILNELFNDYVFYITCGYMVYIDSLLKYVVYSFGAWEYYVANMYYVCYYFNHSYSVGTSFI